VQTNTKMAFNSPSSMLNNASQDWNTVSDLHLPETFLDFDGIAFLDDDDSSAEDSLQGPSKKISKTSSASQSGSKHTSHKRSKRARNPWTPKEDAKLLELMKKYGQSWAMISSMLEGRTGKQVRDRYLNKLRPNIKCGDWSPEEDALLVRLCKEIGNRWSLIATHLPGRTEGQVKNRFYSHIKKRLELNGSLSQISSSNSESEGYASFTASPQVEEPVFDFGQELDFSNFNGCGMNLSNQSLSFANKTQIPSLMISKPYNLEEEALSEKSTSQGPSSYKDSNSPLRMDFVDPTDVISYTSENLLCAKPKQVETFDLSPVQNDCHFDDLLGKVTNYFVQNSGNTSDVDSFFSDDLKTGEANLSSFPDDRLAQLSRRKAYLEMALANTLKELKGL